MSYYQNVFDSEFRQSMIFSDRQFNINFIAPANKNQMSIATSWNSDTYDFSVAANRVLTIYYSYDLNFKIWTAITVTVGTTSTTKASDVVTALNANAYFSQHMTAITNMTSAGNKVVIRSNKNKSALKFYIANTGAETKLKFNKYAGVADLPSYMDRHTIANVNNYPDSFGMLVKLSQVITGNTVANPTVVTSVAHGLTSGDVIYVVNSNSTPTLDGARTVTVTGVDTFTIPVNVTTAGTYAEFLNPINYNVVTDYGIDYTTAKMDWELIRGRVGLFNFQKITVDGSDRITQIIEYSTGALAGDIAKKIMYSYTGANKNPDQVTEIPYVLKAADLLTVYPA